MTPAEKSTSLKLLAALAWADGVLDPHEIDSLVDFISSIGPWEGSEIKTVLREQTALQDATVRELAGLSPPAVAHLLSTAAHMVNQARPATAEEQAIIRAASDATLGPGRWDQTQRWLTSELEARRHRRELFG